MQQTLVGLGIVGDACLDLQAVVAASRHDLGVPQGEPGHVVGGDRPLVIGEQVGRDPSDAPQGGVDAGQHGGDGLVPGGEHHPEPAPCQPGAEQHRLPTVDDRALPPVELEPHPRLGNPGPVGPTATGTVGGLRLGDGPTGGAFVAGKPHRDEVIVVDDVGSNLASRTLDEFLDLCQVGIDDAWSTWWGRDVDAGGTALDVVGDGLWITSDELCRRVGTARQIKRFVNLHDLPVILGHGHLRWNWFVGRNQRANPLGWSKWWTVMEICCPPTGNSRVRQRGFPCPPTGSMSCPLSEERFDPVTKVPMTVAVTSEG